MAGACDFPTERGDWSSWDHSQTQRQSGEEKKAQKALRNSESLNGCVTSDNSVTLSESYMLYLQLGDGGEYLLQTYVLRISHNTCANDSVKY